MNRRSKYHGLKHVVECKRNGSTFFEPIAAFDSSRIAEYYAKDCAKLNIAHEYRSLERLSSGKFKCRFTTERETTDDYNTNHFPAAAAV